MRQRSFAYLAGIIDGEGCITITVSKYKDDTKPKQRGVHYVSRIQVTNTDRRLINWLVSNFGGNVHGNGRRKKGWKESYKWLLTGHKVQESLLLAVLPYLILKREQALTVLEFIRMNGENNPAKRQIFKERINVLNRRGSLSQEANTQTTSQEVMIESVPAGDCGSAVMVT